MNTRAQENNNLFTTIVSSSIITETGHPHRLCSVLPRLTRAHADGDAPRRATPSLHLVRRHQVQDEAHAHTVIDTPTIHRMQITWARGVHARITCTCDARAHALGYLQNTRMAWAHLHTRRGQLRKIETTGLGLRLWQPLNHKARHRPARTEGDGVRGGPRVKRGAPPATRPAARSSA